MKNVTSEAESSYAWARLGASLLLMTIGSSGMYVVGVALPQLQAEFGVGRSEAAMPYSATLIGFALGGVMMGRLADRFGVMVPVLISALGLGAGYIAGGMAGSLWQFTLAQGVLIGFFGSSATFAPLVADTSLWFTRRRGIAVAICISGNYLSGTVWPPIIQYFIDTAGWRSAYVGSGVFCIASMLPLAFMLRRRPPALQAPSAAARALQSDMPLGLRPNVLLAVLCVAGVACCVAMSMPLVHIVAYCGDLGFPAARGAEMLSLMFGFGVVSRLAFGFITDRLGGLRSLLLASTLQAIAVALFLPFDSLTSLYVVSALFGAFQGGLVPTYAIIAREYFPPRDAGTKVATVLMATLLGMALGGWMSGWIFDLTGSYQAAFLNGFAWNVANVAIIAWLLTRARRVGQARIQETPAY